MKEEFPVLQLEERHTPVTHPLHGPLRNGSSIGQQLTELSGVSAMSNGVKQTVQFYYLLC